MEVKNLSWNEHIVNKKNQSLLPKSLRGLIVGKSGCGKTTLLLNLLLRPGWLDYSKNLKFTASCSVCGFATPLILCPPKDKSARIQFVPSHFR